MVEGIVVSGLDAASQRVAIPTAVKSIDIPSHACHINVARSDECVEDDAASDVLESLPEAEDSALQTNQPSANISTNVSVVDDLFSGL